MGEQLEHARGLRDVAEIGGEDGVEGLRDEPAHVAETLHHARRFFIVNVQHEGEREKRLVTVGGDERDAGELLVVAVRLDLAADPAEDEVHRRHVLDFQGVGIQRVFAGREGFAPDAAAARARLVRRSEIACQSRRRRSRRSS